MIFKNIIKFVTSQDMNLVLDLPEYSLLFFEEISHIYNNASFGDLNNTFIEKHGQNFIFFVNLQF